MRGVIYAGSRFQVPERRVRFQDLTGAHRGLPPLHFATRRAFRFTGRGRQTVARTSAIGTLVTLPAASLTTFARLADLGVIKALPVLAYGE